MLPLSQMADKSQSGTLEGDEFVLFYKMLTQREDVLRIFQEYSSDGQKLSQSDLEDFLGEEQLERGDIQQHAKQLIEHYEPSDAGTHNGYLILIPEENLSALYVEQSTIKALILVLCLKVLTTSFCLSSQAAECHDI